MIQLMIDCVVIINNFVNFQFLMEYRDSIIGM